MELKNRIVVITGASKGLGEELAKGFVAKGAKVTISARNKKSLERVASSIGAEYEVADVTKATDTSMLIENVVKKHGRVDIFVNNAGIWMKHGPITDLDTDRLHELIEVNLFGTINGSKAALIQMKKQRKGTIIKC